MTDTVQIIDDESSIIVSSEGLQGPQGLPYESAAAQAATEAARDDAQDAATSTAADALATAADRVQTGLDRTATGADRTQTGLDRTATGGDRTQTGLDRTATGADRTAVNALLTSFRSVFLGAFASDAAAETFATASSITLSDGVMYQNTTSDLFRVYENGAWANYDAEAQAATTAAQLSAANAATSESLAESYRDAALAAKDEAEAAAADAAADAVATAADRVQTGLDATATGADRVQTGLDVVATAADRVQTGLDRAATGLDAATATTKAGEASSSASTATTQAGNAATTATNFDKRYLGSKATAPTVDNQGAALQTGALYWDTAQTSMRVWTGSAWTPTTELDARVLSDVQLLGGVQYATDMVLAEIRERIRAETSLNSSLASLTTTVSTYDLAITQAIYQLTALADLAGVVARAISGGDVQLRAGSADSPSLAASGDLNTGLFFPAADTVGIATGGVERGRTDSTGRRGFGTNAPSCLVDINDNKFRVRTAQTPASAGAAGNTGDICWDGSYVYVCVSTNSWKRAAIAAW